nr:hypothetical protein [Streptococcus gallolyticus]
MLLSGALIAALGATNVSADETSVDTAATIETAVEPSADNTTVERGATGNGILVASRQWGLTPTVINSSAALTIAIKERHHVVAAVQQDKFSPWVMVLAMKLF